MPERQVEPQFKQPRLSKRKRTERAWAAKKDQRVVLVEELLLRCHGSCELQTPDCIGVGSEVHHARMRSAGGRDIPEDCRWTCAPCHLFAHRNRELAYERGWILRRFVGSQGVDDGDDGGYA